MKKFLLVAAFSLLSAISAFAEKPTPKPFTETLSKATLAVYRGKQECGYKTHDTFFGPLDVWGCKFESHFTCTATVIKKDGQGQYLGLTAGHCFTDAAIEKGWKYYVSDTLGKAPVLHAINIIKSANEDRYDYAIFNFHSLEDYPTIDILKEGPPPVIGTEIMNVNFSLGVVKQVVDGKIVSAQITGDEDKEHESLQGRLFVTIPIGPGASGSAIVDKKTHQIIGLTEAVFPGTQMATIVIPMGDQFKHFYDDDTAGLKAEKAPKGEDIRLREVPPVRVPTIWELFVNLIKRIFGR